MNTNVTVTQKPLAFRMCVCVWGGGGETCGSGMNMLL